MTSFSQQIRAGRQSADLGTTRDGPCTLGIKSKQNMGSAFQRRISSGERGSLRVVQPNNGSNHAGSTCLSLGSEPAKATIQALNLPLQKGGLVWLFLVPARGSPNLCNDVVSVAETPETSPRKTQPSNGLFWTGNWFPVSNTGSQFFTAGAQMCHCRDWRSGSDSCCL